MFYHQFPGTKFALTLPKFKSILLSAKFRVRKKPTWSKFKPNTLASPSEKLEKLKVLATMLDNELLEELYVDE